MRRYPVWNVVFYCLGAAMNPIYLRAGVVFSILTSSLIGISVAAQAGAPLDPLADHPIHAQPFAATSPTGLSPEAIKAAYGFSTNPTAGTGQTIAIVAAYDSPNAEADLAVFNTALGLPECSTLNGCFTKVDQTGGTKYPRSDQGWALEISLDVQWAHAIAPGAKILLVEAKTAGFSNLMAAEDYASLHANYVSNSWGSSEFAGEAAYDSHFATPGVSYFVSSGDTGTPASYPSSSPNVISVGGTTLNFTGNVLTSETGWAGSGGGCSKYEVASAIQQSFASFSQANCAGSRGTPDVALDADPMSGVSVYNSTRYRGQKGWWIVGGTSASAPMWAARAAISGAIVDAGYVYGSVINFRDITSGSNGLPTLVGYDLVTGRGSWLG